MEGLKLSYDQPAVGWDQGLPIGNGRMGAVIRGGQSAEIWDITEITYWSGQPEHLLAANTKEDIETIRSTFFAGNYEHGEQLAQRYLEPAKQNYGTHLSLCKLKIDFNERDSYSSFYRELDLEQAIVSHRIWQGQQLYTSEAFASHADDILAARFISNLGGGLSFTLSLLGETPLFDVRVDREAATISFTAQATEHMHSNGQCGVHAYGEIKVVVQGGEIEQANDSLIVKRADEAMIYISAVTDYKNSSDNWTKKARELLNDALLISFEQLRQKHIADYRELYSRVTLELGTKQASSLPTDQRLAALRNGNHEDASLFALFYQYGRYLTIAGSREDSPLPLNLQGMWNDGEANRMQWSCDYHLDINTQMNYYPTESSNLAECHKPLLKFIEQLADSGTASAKGFYGSKGWVAHVFTNAWGFTSPGWETSWGLNVTGGLWIAMQLREHYEYNLDESFLKETAYPVMKEAAIFFLDYMTVHPHSGYLVTGPSNSPENSFYLDDTNKTYALSMGATMDISLVRDLLQFCLTSAIQLGIDEEWQVKWKDALTKLPPLQIGEKGQLQEWLEDYGEAQPDHRHLSHLYGLYPGNEITPKHTPEWSQASATTLNNRMNRSTVEDVEFTLALFAASFARLKEGEKAYKQLSYLVSDLCFDNLFTYSKAGIAGAETNIFVIDGNFGGTAAIGEMLFQSHAGELELLPAIPSLWDSGKVTGLRAKGNIEIDLSWEQGQLTSVVIYANSACEKVVRYGDLSLELVLTPGDVYRMNGFLQLV